MIFHDVTATLSFNQKTGGGTETAGTTIDVRVNADGFFDPAGSAPRVKRCTNFPRARLRTVIDHIVLLRDAS